MKCQFSFSYGGNKFVFAAEKDRVYELEKGVSVRVETREHKDFNAVEWVVYFENMSNKNSAVFSAINDCDILLPLEFPLEPKPGYRPTEGDACVITMNGMVDGRKYWENDKVSATEFALNYEYLDKSYEKTKKFTNYGDRGSSDKLIPIFDITSSGRGYIAAIGWTGFWKVEFSKKNDGISMKSGLNNVTFYLEPGEKIRTSSTVIMKYEQNEDKYNKYRKFIAKYYSHKSRINTVREGLMACELWGGLTSEEMKKRITEFKDHEIRFEDVWIDAAWYGNCTNCESAFVGDWFAQTGNWTVNQRVHPNGLKDVVECAKKAGMRLMLWFEPERAIEGTPVTINHPEWFLSKPKTPSKILNYGVEEARQYVLDTISTYVSELDLSCYRQDFNTSPIEYFERADKENRIGITEIKHIMGMYKLWDELLEKYPHLIIDDCSGGGRRIDIETLRRSIPFFRSDYQCNFNENSDVLQCHNSNASLYFPYMGCTSKTKGDTYAVRSSYSSSWGGAFYNTIFQSMDENDFAWAKKVTDEYRSIRKYFSKDFYNLGSNTFDESAWTIWQYHDSETQSGIVMAFRRNKSLFDKVSIDLNGLIENQNYQVVNLDTQVGQVIEKSLEICLTQKRSSVIFEYKKIN